jgi:outer membrane biosynthesis protein TonB
MKQSTASMQTLTETFYLSEGERQLVMAADVGEGIFFAGQNHVALRVVASDDEHVIITTNPEEIIKKEVVKTTPKIKKVKFPREESLLKANKPKPQPPKKEKEAPKDYYQREEEKKEKPKEKNVGKKSDEKKTMNNAFAGKSSKKNSDAPKKSNRVRYTVDQYTPPEIFKDKK